MPQATLERRAAWIAVTVALALMATKIAAYRLTGSTAVFGDAMESLVNVAASLLAVWSVWMAHRPADRTHPYGHGKAEFVSAAVEGGLVVAAAGAVAVKSVSDFGATEDVLTRIDLGVMLLVATVAVNGLVGGARGRRRAPALRRMDQRCRDRQPAARAQHGMAVDRPRDRDGDGGVARLVRLARRATIAGKPDGRAGSGRPGEGAGIA
jgi:hypothetical protein